MYTVVNRVGVPSPEHVKSDDELFAYLLKVSICLSVCPSVFFSVSWTHEKSRLYFLSFIKSLSVTLMVASERALFVVSGL